MKIQIPTLLLGVPDPPFVFHYSKMRYFDYAGSPHSKDDSSTCSYSHQIAAPLITPAKELNFAGDGFIGKDRNSTFGRGAGSLRWCPRCNEPSQF